MIEHYERGTSLGQNLRREAKVVIPMRSLFCNDIRNGKNDYMK